MNTEETTRILTRIKDRINFETTDAQKKMDALNNAIQKLEQEQKYCDRNICLRNEYNGIGCDECEVTKSQEPCKDCISRQAAKKALEDRFMEMQKRHSVNKYETNFCLNTILELPSVKPQSKTGHWIKVSDGYGDNAYICECSECKDTVWVYKDADRKWNFCPNCGAKMIEPQESEEIE